MASVHHHRLFTYACACAAVVVALLLGGILGPGPAAAATVTTESPVGTIVAYGGTTEPAGWLWADGSVKQQASYPALYALIGATYNTGGEGAGNFRLPCLMACASAPSGRVPLGVITGYSNRFTLGRFGGAIDHTHGWTHGHALGPETNTTSDNGAHDHVFSKQDPSVQDSWSWRLGSPIWGTAAGNTMSSSSVGDHNHTITHSHTLGTTPTLVGGAPFASGAANPPFLAVRYLIRATAATDDPCGAIWGNGGSSPLTGTLAADDVDANRTTDAYLFGCLDPTIGKSDAGGATNGNGTTTFDLPCLQSCGTAPAERLPLGKASGSGTASAVGDVGGQRNHTHTLAAHAHSIAPTSASLATSNQNTGNNHGHTVYATSISGEGTSNPTTGGTWSHNARTSSGPSVKNGEPNVNGHLVYPHDHGGATQTSGSGTSGASEVPYVGMNYMLYRAAAYQPKIGTIAPYAGATAPPGWIFADNTPRSITRYAQLYAVVGETYGNGGDGAGGSNFSIDMRGRVAMGTGPGVTRGATAGQLDHVHTAPAHTHPVDPQAMFTQWTSHYHTVNIDDVFAGIARFDGYQATWENNPFVSWYAESGTVCSANGSIDCDYGYADTKTHLHVFTSTHGGATGSATSTNLDAANPPYLATNFIVKAYDAPGAPGTVGDGGTANPASDVDTTTTTGSVNITWTAGSDGGNGIAGYDWCISVTSSCSGAVRSGQTTGAGVTVSTSGSPPLNSNVLHYSCVATRDLDDNVGAYTCSDGFFVEYVSQTQTSPVGTIVAYGGTTVPTGWLLADGSAVSRTTYADLFDVAGTTFNTGGEAGTDFRLPCLMLCPSGPSGRMSFGASAGLGVNYAHGKSGGIIDHAHTFFHTHYISAETGATSSAGAHTHTATPDYAANLTNTGGWGGWTGTATFASAGAHTHTANHTHTVTASDPGMTTANPPFLTVNYLVKYQQNAPDPCGAIWGNARGSVPSGALAANGATTSRTGGTATLFGCLGTTFNTGGEAITDFRLPCLQGCSIAPAGRIPLGRAASGTGSTLGASGGQMDHTHTLNAHSHTIQSTSVTTSTNGAHTHTVTASAVAGSGQTAPPGEVWANNTRTSDSAGGHEHDVASHNHGGTTGTSAAEVSGVANPRFRTVNYMTYTGAGYVAALGTLTPYAGTTAPPGWLLADGSDISSSAYPGLYAAIGQTHGQGTDGAGTAQFAVDMAGRFGLGNPGSGTGNGIGTTGGSMDHTHTMGTHTHSVASASPTLTTFAGHYHNVNVNSIAGGTASFRSNNTSGSTYAAWYAGSTCDTILGNDDNNHPDGTNCDNVSSTTNGSHTHTYAHSHGGVTAAQARTSADPSVNLTDTGTANPPYLATNYIVKAWDDPGAPGTVGDGGTAVPASDVDATTSTGTISITWTAGTDGGRGIGGYDWCIVADTPGSCTGALRSGYSAGTGVTVSTTTPAFTANPATTYYSCVRTKDPYIGQSAYTCSDGFRVHRVPTTPTLVSPIGGSSTQDLTPDLQATYADPDGDSGQVDFSITTTASCTGASPIASSTLASGGTATVTTGTLTSGLTYYWCARARDSSGATSAWTAVRQLAVGPASLSLSVDFTTRSLGTLATGIDSFVDSTLTVGTDASTGYSVTATDTSDTAAATAGGNNFPDWVADGSAPSQWDTGTAGFWGITVRDATVSRLGKWGTATPGSPWPQDDTTNNLYVGLDNTVATLIHRRDTYTASSETILVTHRANPSPSQPVGSYSGTVTFTIVANP